MSGIAGIVNLNRKVDSEIENINEMTKTLSHRGKDIQKVKNAEFGVFGCTPTEFVEDKNRQIPISLKTDNTEFTICFDGLIYNRNELKNQLKNINTSTNLTTDAEIVLLSYIKWGIGCLQRLNGIFAFTVWDSNNHELFMARDRFGIKPLYYTFAGDSLIFASEIKGILKHPSVSAILDKDGICEVMGLGPAHSQGTGVLKDIYEIIPATCATFNKNGFNCSKYWHLDSKTYDNSFGECLKDVKTLTTTAINSQIEDAGRNMCYFLSGGLDSSIITALAAKKHGRGINTFSLSYRDHEAFFTPNEYQPASDDYYINLMSETFDTNHHVVTVDNEALIDLLYDAMKARDLPGMGDVDSSLYYLCKEMGNEFDGAVSGECADEVFGGYPWFHRKEDFEAKTFPWSKNIDFRKQVLSPELNISEYLSDYINLKYNNSISNCPICRDDSPEEKRRREIAFLNLNWFMYTLGARSERIGMNCGLEIRMPFCDYKLVEYMWNVPWDFKAYNDREKGLLRMCFEDLLPDEILWRKKSPFPKTHNPEYEVMIKNMAKAVLNDKNSPISNIINVDYMHNLMSEDSDYSKPWFGQLMALPQLYAYIVQIDMWLKEYNIKIKL
ncbi:MAG: asparagine synthase (glutamine-hydrolyzing) [Clostridia bacterium]|nr:asparagine synthase (glutamine-hydrolyzing) [Clostridia bacterium]